MWPTMPELELDLEAKSGALLDQSLTCAWMQAVTELLKLAPSTATLVTRDDSGRVISEEEVPTALIQRGDLLKVRSAFCIAIFMSLGSTPGSLLLHLLLACMHR